MKITQKKRFWFVWLFIGSDSLMLLIFPHFFNKQTWVIIPILSVWILAFWSALAWAAEADRERKVKK